MTAYHGIAEAELLDAIDRLTLIDRPAREALDQSLADLGIDSLELFKFAMDLEDAVKLRLDVEKITPLSTLQEVLQALQPA